MQRLLVVVGAMCAALSAHGSGETAIFGGDDIWKLVYGSHVWVSIEENPAREAALVALLELDEHNPEAAPETLSGIIGRTMAAYQSRYGAAAGYRLVSRDEVLAGFYALLVADPEYGACRPVNLGLIKPLADIGCYGTASFAFRFQSENEQTLSIEHARDSRQQLIDALAARALGSPRFAGLLDSVLYAGTGVSARMRPAEILAHSPALAASAAMAWLAGLAPEGGAGSIEVATADLEAHFTQEMAVLKDTITANTALHREIEGIQGDLGSYLNDPARQAALAAQQEQAKAAQAQRITSAGAAAQALGCATLKSRPVTARQMSSLASSMSAVASGLQAMDSAAKFSKLTACTNFVSAGLTLVSMFIDTGPTPEEIILNEINALKDAIADLATNMDYRFDQVDQTLVQVLGKLDDSIQLIGEIGQDVTTIRRELLDVQTDLTRLERMIAEYIDYQERRRFIEDANTKLQYEQRTGDQMSWEFFKDWSESNFYTWAVSHCTDPISSPVPPSGYAYPDSELLDKLTTFSLESNLNYIRGFLQTRLGVTGLSQGTLANPRDWYAGASAYLNLSIENPLHYRRLPMGASRVGDIIQRGRGIEAFLRALSLTGTTQAPQPNNALFDALLAYYAQQLQAYLAAVEAEQVASGETFGFNPAMWLDWEAQVQPVHVAETATAGATAWTRIPLDIVKIAAGKQHFLALRSGGTVVAWGDNGSRQCEVPADLNNVIDVKAGAYHSLALRADRTVVSWGGYDNSHVVPEGLSDVIAISAGINHNLALRADGKVVAWGGNYSGECTIPAALADKTVVAIAAAGHPGGWGNHSLALTDDGKVYAWGSNSYGECNVPAFAGKVVAIAATGLRSAAVLEDGSVVGWPVALTATAPIDELALGFLFHDGPEEVPFTVGLTQDHRVEVLKGPAAGVPESGDIIQVAVAGGIRHAVALHSDGTLTTWGDYSIYAFDGTHGQPAGPSIVDIACTDSHTVVLYSDGSVRQNGNKLIDLPPAIAVAAGQAYDWYKQFSLALLADGSVAAWGDNSAGQCNVPASIAYVPGHTNTVKAVAIAAGSMDHVNTGGGHSLALLEDGTVLAWGVNAHKQCDVPAGLGGVVAIDAGHRHSVALLKDGTVKVWGDNTWGQLNAPTQYHDIVSISAGFSHTLALRANGDVIGWGANHYGQCNPPAGLANVVAVEAGFSRSLAILADGTVRSWGYDPWGYGAYAASLTGVLRIAAGGQGKDNAVLQAGYPGIPGDGPVTVERQSRPAASIGTPFRQFYAHAIQGNWFIQNGNVNLAASAAQLAGARLLLESVLALALPASLEYDDALRGFLLGNEPIAHQAALGELYAAEFARLVDAPFAHPVDPADALWLRLDAFKARLQERLEVVAAVGRPEIPRMLGHTLTLLEILKQAHAGGGDGGICPLPQLEITPAAAPQLILHGEPYIRYTLERSTDLGAWSPAGQILRDAGPVSLPLPARAAFYRVPVQREFN